MSKLTKKQKRYLNTIPYGDGRDQMKHTFKDFNKFNKENELDFQQQFDEARIAENNFYSKPDVEAFCVEVNPENKELLRRIRNDFHNGRGGELEGTLYLCSDSKFNTCFGSNNTSPYGKTIKIVDTDTFLRLIGKSPQSVHLKDVASINVPETPFNGTAYGDIEGITRLVPQTEQTTQEKVESVIKKTIDELNKKIYTKEDMERCFVESRLTHPMVGFKHDNFDEYIKSHTKNEASK